MDHSSPSFPVWKRQGARLTHVASKLCCAQARDGAARRRGNIPVPTAPPGTPRSCPSLWPCQTEECPPGMSHFPNTPALYEWSVDLHCLAAGSAIPEILDQYSRGLGTAHNKFTGLATLPFQNTERELKWGFSLSSPSTAPAQHFPNFLAGKTNTFGIYSELQPLLNPTAGFGQYQLLNYSLNLGLKTNKKLLAEVYTLFLPGSGATIPILTVKSSVVLGFPQPPPCDLTLLLLLLGKNTERWTKPRSCHFLTEKARGCSSPVLGQQHFRIQFTMP